jgi:hypothetical protein
LQRFYRAEKVDGLPEDEIETRSIRRICSGKHAGVPHHSTTAAAAFVVRLLFDAGKNKIKCAKDLFPGSAADGTVVIAMAIYLAFESSSRDFKILIPAFVEGRTNRKPSHFILTLISVFNENLTFCSMAAFIGESVTKRLNGALASAWQIEITPAAYEQPRCTMAKLLKKNTQCSQFVVICVKFQKFCCLWPAQHPTREKDILSSTSTNK